MEARKLLKLVGAYKLYERMLESEVKKGPLPRHIAIILDGNRRWARSLGMPSWMGHRYGAQKAEEVINWCFELGVDIVTLYVLSTENLHRPRDELEKLFRVIEEYLDKALRDERFEKHEVKVKALGNLDLLPSSIRDKIMMLEEKTARFSKRFLNVAIAYGGRSEIVQATKRIAQDVLSGKLKVEDIDERVFEKYLFTAHLPQPSPDLVIRTSGEERLSNFLLWQIAYSEFMFLDVYWPEFRRIDLLRAIRTFQKRQRRFGR